jgi:putative transposase
VSKPRYLWRQLTPEQRADLVAWRKENLRPWHSPPHRPSLHTHFHLAAACHEHVNHWLDWPFSSAADYLRAVSREEALRIWNEYPILDYGKSWDDSSL